MGIIRGIENASIKEAMKGLTRQYFVGNLKKPQKLKFFHSEKIEIGITVYDDYASELPHKHFEACEYQYMISGRTQYLDLDTNEIHEFIAGDFFEMIRQRLTNFYTGAIIWAGIIYKECSL